MHLALVRLTHHLRNTPFSRHTCPHFCFCLPDLLLFTMMTMMLLVLLGPYQISKLLTLQKL